MHNQAPTPTMPSAGTDELAAELYEPLRSIAHKHQVHPGYCRGRTHEHIEALLRYEVPDARDDPDGDRPGFGDEVGDREELEQQPRRGPGQVAPAEVPPARALHVRHRSPAQPATACNGRCRATATARTAKAAVKAARTTTAVPDGTAPAATSRPSSAYQ